MEENAYPREACFGFARLINASLRLVSSEGTFLARVGTFLKHGRRFTRRLAKVDGVVVVLAFCREEHTAELNNCK